MEVNVHKISSTTSLPSPCPLLRESECERGGRWEVYEVVGWERFYGRSRETARQGIQTYS